MRLFKRKQSAIVESDWYYSAIPERRREYDAFGPWTYEIKKESDVPPCFLPRFKDLDGARIIIKIPIDKERRQVRPGQNLYRAILAAFDDRICYLSQKDGVVESRTVLLSGIQAFRNYIFLLRGDFTIFLSESEIFTFQYNTVSYLLIEKVLDFLRSKIAENLRENTMAIVPEIPEVKDFYFNNLIRDLKVRDSSSHVIYCEEPGVRCTDSRGRRRRRLGILVLETNFELIFINRGKDFKRFREAWYATSSLIFPKSRLQGYKISAPNKDLPAAGCELLLKLSGHEFTYQLFGNPEKLTAALNALVFN